jgi:two-component system nitrate/nitrite response regulator NarL
VNLDSGDTLLKVLELTFMDMDQRVLFVFSKEALVTTAKASVEPRDYRLATSGQSPLSPRERQVLIALAEGKSNKLIARQYGLSEATIKVHLKSVLRKIGKHNRTQAAIWAIEHGLRDHHSEGSIIPDAPSSSRDDGLPPVTTVSASSRL